MIRASVGTWLNLATTIAFQVLFSARFGASITASAYAIVFSIAVAIGGLFVSVSQIVVLPRMLNADGTFSERAAWLLRRTMLLTAITGGALFLASPALGTALAPMLDVEGDLAIGLMLFASVFAVTAALAGEFATIALAHDRRFLPAIAPALPSTVAVLYLALLGDSTVLGTLAAVAAGSTLQLALMIAAAARPQSRVTSGSWTNVGSIVALTLLQLTLLGLIAPIQRIVAGISSGSGPAHLDYAIRGMAVGQQLLIGGILLSAVPDWAAVYMRTGQISRHVAAVLTTAILLLSTSASVALVVAPELTKLFLEHGQFTPADTASVAALIRIMTAGFVAEGIALVLVRSLLARARNDLVLEIGFVRLGIQVVLTVLLGLSQGAVGVAAAYSVSQVVVAVLALAMAARLGLLRGAHGLLLRSSVVSAAAGTTALLLLVSQVQAPAWMEVAVVTLVAAFGTVLLGLARPLAAGFRRLEPGGLS